MKVTKTEIRFKTGFQQPKTGLPKKPVLTSLLLTQVKGQKHCSILRQKPINYKTKLSSSSS